MDWYKTVFLIILLYISNIITAQNTKIEYLSGIDAVNTVKWEFYCSNGMKSGHWDTIEVPSCWEQQGFGSYNYGHDKFENRLNETGLYRYNFDVPSNWKGNQVKIVFDGVMTDALVKINGKQAGPVHQGAFYQFKYDISKLLKYGKKNHLEVFVKKHSDNESVSLAERKADFWVFGGIFRPVFLEVKPTENIERVAIDAKANGIFKSDIYISGIKNAVTAIVEIQTLDGEKTASFSQSIDNAITRVSGQLEKPKTWTPEFPNLYNAVFSIQNQKGKIIHKVTERFGFRTIEVKANDGIYVNGARIKMKGVNRHTFRPKYGRTSSKAFSIEDVNLMKDMNMNAVRMSHYPPDEHFLDVCDSLGLFVLDELTGWQYPPYDDIVGRKLLEEMIAHDVNHPSIIIWDNGNEGGENNNLNDDFAELDIQKREVILPQKDYKKTNTVHYIGYNYLSHDGFCCRKIFFPTEFLHGLYDGGHGAGLDDYWEKMWDDPLCAGGFLWVFADETIERSDRRGALDSDGNHAPDGILGPYHEKEGSFYAIKEIWSPVYFEKRYITKEFDGTFRIENRYQYTNLNQCTFKAEWIGFSGPDDPVNEIILSREDITVQLQPEQKGRLNLRLPEKWQHSDALRISAYDPYGRHIYTWNWPVKFPGEKARELIHIDKGEKPVLTEKEDLIVVTVAGLKYTFSKRNGLLKEILNKEGTIPLSNGPVFFCREKKITEVNYNYAGNKVVLGITFEGDDHFTWTINEDGLLDLDIAYDPAGCDKNTGVSFDFPEERVACMKWLGNGPFRVYKNRMRGAEFGLWKKNYNNTVTGASEYEYPEFKGYHAETYWVKIEGNGSPGFKVFVHSNDVFFRMLTPEEGEDPRNTKVEYPIGDISFLHGINPTGTKFGHAVNLGPQSSSYGFGPSHEGKLKMKLSFDFR